MTTPSLGTAPAGPGIGQVTEAAAPPVPVLGFPRVAVTLGGRDVELLSLRVRQEASAPAVCQLELLPGAGVAPAGAAVSVRVDGTEVFAGEVVRTTTVLPTDGRARLQLWCFDRAHRLRRLSAVTAYEGLTVSGLADRLAGPAGLTVDATETGPMRDRVIQLGESHLALLGRLVDQTSLWWRVDGDTLRLRPWEPEGERVATWGRDLYEATVADDATLPAGRERRVGWDAVTRAVVSATAGPGHTVGATGGDEVTEVGAFASDDIAEAAASAQAGRRAAATVVLSAVVRGDPAWRPGLACRVAGQPGPVAGPHLLTTVEHVLDAAAGYVCRLSSQPLPAREEPTPATATSLALAEVVDIDDPQTAGRVRVRFPAWDGCESEWLPLLALGAGAGKGLVCQPDEGDTVVVLHPLADPGRGVVLGGIHAGSRPLEDGGIAGGSVRRYLWATPDGQAVRLDRDGDRVVVTNKAGSRIELSQAGVRLHAEADLTIEAPGHALTFRALTVDFDRAES